MNQKTTLPKVNDLNPKWFVIDAAEKTLGRIATQVADLLRGKKDVNYTEFYDHGNYVIILNASKVRFTGKKLEDKTYYKHTGYMGHLREQTLKAKMSTKPEEVFILAVKRMLPKNKLGKKQLERLKVFPLSEHDHQANKPTIIDLKD